MSLKPSLKEKYEGVLDPLLSDKMFRSLYSCKSKDSYISCLRSLFDFSYDNSMRFFYYIHTIFCDDNSIDNPFLLSGKDNLFLLYLISNGGVCTHNGAFDDLNFSNGMINTAFNNLNRKRDDSTGLVVSLVFKLEFVRGGVFYMINPFVYNKVFGLK